MSQLILILTIVGLLSSGIIAGVFYTFSTFVMQALGRLSAAEGVRAMQLINITVFAPLMMGLFVGAVPFGLILAGLAIWEWDANSLYVLLGALLYVVGTFGITAVGNVPLNEKLKDMPAEEEATHKFWGIYQRRWMIWNHVRTVAAIGSTVMYAIALAV